MGDENGFKLTCEYFELYRYSNGLIVRCASSSLRMSVLGTLALPKLNLQFLTVHDYLLRNFHLFRLESTCTFLHFVRNFLHEL